jgi:hypothetical protein
MNVEEDGAGRRRVDGMAWRVALSGQKRAIGRRIDILGRGEFPRVVSGRCRRKETGAGARRRRQGSHRGKEGDEGLGGPVWGASGGEGKEALGGDDESLAILDEDVSDRRGTGGGRAAPPDDADGVDPCVVDVLAGAVCVLEDGDGDVGDVAQGAGAEGLGNLGGQIALAEADRGEEQG